ncbi:DNA polymerase III subunit delta [Ectothiorhodospira lacustris]|uniref:DNA polymerase III subunit delta n=1 Tax=Ectothiorhodospira lacustris TaxID=2899127 RepID=UPI001EE8B7BA|nr:DNA polymerase III subunit delta [Ectothiorhodospira lacustris]MCG5500649.1 DNA polymerase III subunit delta [Ectothiorhodospira lacustris]
MRLKPEQLESHLQKGLASVYLISGEEPLQLMEAADAIRARARAEGFDEREVFTVDKGFDWGQVQTASDSLSLFAQRRVLELRMPSGKPGVQGGKVLEAYARQPAADTVLIVQCGKLERQEQKSRWCQALEQAGVMIQVWPLDLAGTEAWITRRMGRRGLHPTAAAARLLAERVEGNLLAAAQEIDKLVLLQGDGPVDEAAVMAAVADSARFSVYDLTDAALAGEAGRAVRILSGLRGEGTAPVLVSWALAREIRTLNRLAEQAAAGTPPQVVLKSVWPPQRQPVVRQALRRLSLQALGQLLRAGARADQVAKGQKPGSPWDELLDLTLGLAGHPSPLIRNHSH